MSRAEGSCASDPTSGPQSQAILIDPPTTSLLMKPRATLMDYVAVPWHDEETVTHSWNSLFSNVIPFSSVIRIALPSSLDPQFSLLGPPFWTEDSETTAWMSSVDTDYTSYCNCIPSLASHTLADLLRSRPSHWIFLADAQWARSS